MTTDMPDFFDDDELANVFTILDWMDAVDSLSDEDSDSDDDASSDVYDEMHGYEIESFDGGDDEDEP